MEQAPTRQVPHHQHHHSPPPMMLGKDHHQQRPSVGAEKASDTMVLQTNSPMPTNQDPVKWSREEVLNWLKWCQEEFSLDNVNAEKFTMNGKALCLMPKQSFCDRAPECGDILYELLQKLFRKECRFYHPNSSEPRSSPDPQFNRISGSSENQNVSGSSQETLGYQGNLTIPPSNSSPRLPIDLSAQPEKPNTPCSDSGHSSPDTAEDLRLAATNNPASAPHYRRQNVPPMITLTSSNRSSPQRMFEKQSPRHLGGKSLQDGLSESVMDTTAVPPSPTKRLRMEYGQPGGVASAFPQVNTGHIELRHRANTAERIEQHNLHQGSHQSLHPHSHPRLLGRRRLSSDDGLATGRAPSTYGVERHSTGALIGMGGLYNHSGLPTLQVPCTVPSLVAGSAILSRLQQRRNSTGGAEGIGDNLGQSPHHPGSISSMPRRRSMDPDDVFLLDEDGFETRKAAGGDCRLLWDFLVQLLKNKTYMPYIRWEDRRERVFRILDPVQIANLWGLQKNRTNMTYEKLSRALRYYYKMGILQKEQGQKLTYRFLQDPKDIANSQRFSKMARNKDNPEHSEVTGSPASPIHHFSTASSTSPLVMSSTPSTATSMSMQSSAMMSSTMLPSLMTPSSLGSNRMYGLPTQVPHSTERLYPDHEDSCQSSSIGQRSSVHMASTSSTPSPSPPVTGDDPVAVATHQMEGVSMMALTAQWQAGNSGTSDTKVEGLKVKEEPRSRPQSPEMEC
ncbi:ets DNA-binding protein pokkuri-like isoform X2 [Lytechinus variegatus]|uniref:ets DNA-binding protein pokkuri-like isoform X2 n=1 Tax=Lytechinus variegatus TaxID=7654 RepID=UPI001BB1253D|nr:ets DNA-binding protein pokkuri-like isoform X2 [Lytechinus variegatus]